jgi:hypothetical protein
VHTSVSIRSTLVPLSRVHDPSRKTFFGIKQRKRREEKEKRREEEEEEARIIIEKSAERMFF